MADNGDKIDRVDKLYAHCNDIAEEVKDIKKSHAPCVMEKRVSTIETLNMELIRDSTREIEMMRKNNEEFHGRFYEFEKLFKSVIDEKRSQFKFLFKVKIETYFKLLQYMTGVSFLFYVLSNMRADHSLDESSLFTWVGLAALMFIFPDNPIAPIIKKVFGVRNGNDPKPN